MTSPSQTSAAAQSVPAGSGAGASAAPDAPAASGASAASAAPAAPGAHPPTSQEIVDRVGRGERITRRDEMSDEYFDDLVNLMTMQADSELAGAFGYVPWIQKAPGVEEKLIVANIVRDETRHAKAIYGLLRDLGIDVDSRVEQHDYEFRVRAEGDDLGTKRAANDARVNIFYYPIETWADFVTFNFLMDRGAGHQLEDGLECSYLPWASELHRIFKEELTHIRHGDMWVEKLAKDPSTKDEIQASINRWFGRVMNIFGRPGTSRNARYREFGLKKRDNDAVRAGFVAEVKANCDAWGLTLPEWKADWESADRQERFGA